jgi:hypothetical protein
MKLLFIVLQHAMSAAHCSGTVLPSHGSESLMLPAKEGMTPAYILWYECASISETYLVLIKRRLGGKGGSDVVFASVVPRVASDVHLSQLGNVRSPHVVTVSPTYLVRPYLHNVFLLAHKETQSVERHFKLGRRSNE